MSCFSNAARLVPARQVQVNDWLWVVGPALDKLMPSLVSKVSEAQHKGLFKSHTVDGSIIVSNVAASTFTTTLPSSLAWHKMATGPVRLLSVVLPAMIASPLHKDMLYLVHRDFIVECMVALGWP